MKFCLSKLDYFFVWEGNENLDKRIQECAIDSIVGSIKLKSAYSFFFHLIVKNFPRLRVLYNKCINQQTYTNVTLMCGSCGEVCVPIVLGH